MIVVGSQAILGSIPEHRLPTAATMSLEADILPITADNMETARLADVIEGVAGEFSPLGWRSDGRSGRSAHAQGSVIAVITAEQYRRFDPADYLADIEDVTGYLQLAMAESAEDPTAVPRALGVIAR